MECIFPKLPEMAVDFSGKVASTVLELSEDLRYIFEKQINCDLFLYVGDEVIKCHKAILSARSKWFEFRIDQLYMESSSSIHLKADKQVIDAFLVYIYTGNLRLVESLKVPILDLYEVATLYGTQRFKKLLTRMITTELKSKAKKTREFNWKLRINDCKTKIMVLPLDGFSVDGTDRWSLKMRPLCFSKVKYAFWVHVRKKSTEKKSNIIYIASLEICILESTGRIRKSFTSDHIFRDDGESKMSEHISLCKLLQQATELLPDDVLTLFGKLCITAEDVSSHRMMFEIKAAHEGGVTNELHALSHDMYKLLNTQKYTDVGIFIHGAFSYLTRVHSYILYGRSFVPIYCLGNLVEHGVDGSILWQSFIRFLYTGQPRYLDDHMKEVYSAVSELRLLNTKRKYSSILANYLAENNVFDIVNAAIVHEDTELVYSGLFFMVHNDVIDHPRWIEFTSNHPSWAREIMKAARRKKVKLENSVINTAGTLM